MLNRVEDTENATKQQAIATGTLAAIGIIALLACLAFGLSTLWSRIIAPTTLTYPQLEQKISETGLDIAQEPAIEGEIVPDDNGRFATLASNGHITASIQATDGKEYLSSTPYTPYAKLNLEGDDLLARISLAQLIHQTAPAYPVLTGCSLVATGEDEKPYARIWHEDTRNAYGLMLTSNQYSELHVPQAEIDRISAEMGDEMPQGAGTITPIS